MRRFFKTKMHQNAFGGRAPPVPAGGSSQRSSRPPSCVWGGPRKKREGKGKGERGGKGKKGKGEKWERGGEGKGGDGRECAPPIFTGAPHFLIPGVAPDTQSLRHRPSASRLAIYDVQFYDSRAYNMSRRTAANALTDCLPALRCVARFINQILRLQQQQHRRSNSCCDRNLLHLYVCPRPLAPSVHRNYSATSSPFQ